MILVRKSLVREEESTLNIQRPLVTRLARDTVDKESDEMIKRTVNRIRTRWISIFALIISSVTFGSGLLVFLYMKSPAFEDQLLGQVMKHMDWIIDVEFDKKIKELKPRPVPDENDPNKWFWDYIEKRNREYIEYETKGKWGR